MSLRTTRLLLALGFAFLISGDRLAPTARPQHRPSPLTRIKFRVVTVEEKGAERNVISESSVEGPPNTDFNITLEDERFRMKARFLTDIIRSDSLRFRAKLDTRRFYGSSERALPLYEEDEQTQSLELGFDEAVVLLPFGRNGGDHRLKIEITPMMVAEASPLPAAEERPLEITILKPSPGGIVGFEAIAIPHNFVAEVALIQDGREIATGTSPLLIEEAKEIMLQPKAPENGTVPLVINLKIDGYTRSRPADQVAFSFDISRTNSLQESSRVTIAQNWAGVAKLESSLRYDLSGTSFYADGKKFELSFRFKLAPGEQAD